jgi:hypothetical protein
MRSYILDFEVPRSRSRLRFAGCKSLQELFPKQGRGGGGELSDIDVCHGWLVMGQALHILSNFIKFYIV